MKKIIILYLFAIFFVSGCKSTYYEYRTYNEPYPVYVTPHPIYQYDDRYEIYFYEVYDEIYYDFY
ncbi:hypothetical protein AFI02nite_42270 [Aliivibrio fischeri]|uniref:Lipoprotein n=1 Tax=Aliivibrio fischeri TaxID=668 RepID=A0A510URU7_ALIFS|nr:hypothetical protein AFI02nite_42270 [Aliivibrio fischeri]